MTTKLSSTAAITIELSAVSVALASKETEELIAFKNCIGSAKILLFIFTRLGKATAKATKQFQIQN
jgi:hypothetical protein